VTGFIGHVGEERTRVTAIRVTETPNTTTVPLLLDALADALATAPSGTEFVYSCLARLTDELALDHALVVVEHEGAVQVFNRRRLPITVGWERQIALQRSPGVHTVPERPDHHDLLCNAHRLCTVAFRLDRSRLDTKPARDLEMSLRETDGIVAVGVERAGDATNVQVLVDASRAGVRIRETVRKVARSTTDGPLVLEVIVHEPRRLRTAGGG
jgi:hypothetical protein